MLHGRVSVEWDDSHDTWLFPSELQTLSEHDSLKSFIRSIQELIRIGAYPSAERRLLAEIETPRIPLTRDALHSRAYVLLILGIVLRKSQQHQRAREALGQSLGLLRRVGDTNGTARCLLAIGDVHRSMATVSRKVNGAYVEHARLRYLESAKTISHIDDTTSTSSRLLVAQANWAMAKLDLVSHTIAGDTLWHLTDAWRISRETGSLWAQEECAQIIGRYYLHIGWLRGATQWTKCALSCSLRTGSIDRLIESTLLLGVIYMARVSRFFGRLRQPEREHRPSRDPHARALRWQHLSHLRMELDGLRQSNTTFPTDTMSTSGPRHHGH